jgi:PPK2 family polyphosphate:nucleotide phosphotransferase
MDKHLALKEQLQEYLSTLRVTESKKISLTDFDTDYDHKMISKKEGSKLLKEDIKQLAKMQDMFYADNRYSVLIILQAMDAAGKDGAIKHVMTGFNPQGVKVTPFKTPSSQELDHDYFWRHYKALPGRGEIGIFNRSHYENVLVTRVHPEFILNERVPGIKSVEDIDQSFWEKRYEQINRFEKNLYENGTHIIKFFLHLSKKEQKERFLKRIDKPKKNWKFSAADIAERKLWDQYQKAYSEMLSATSWEHAPWYILPADAKWFTRLCIGTAIFNEFNKLKLSYPSVSEEDKKKLIKAREDLLAE